MNATSPLRSMVLTTALCACGGPALPEGGPAGAGAPRVDWIDAPAEGASRTDPIVVRFSAPIDPASLVEHAVVVVAGEPSAAFVSDLDHPPLSANRLDDLTPGAVTLAEDGLEATFAPSAPLEPETLYTLAVSRAVRDVDGRRLDQAFLQPFVTGDATAGAPEMALRLPTRPDEAVPRNVARVILAFGEPVTGVDDESLRIEGAASRARAADEWCAGCWAVEPRDWLVGDATYEIVATDEIRDADGEPVFRAAPVTFRTAPHADTTPPLLGGASVATSDGCIVGRWLSDEPATSEMLGALVPSFTLVHEVGVAVLAGRHELWLSSTDWAGERASIGPLIVEVDEPPRVVVTEVLANPAGPEPAQEWVELANLGEAPVALAGWRIADSAGEDGLPDVAIAPGEVALVVGPTFDPLDTNDPPPHPAARLLRLDSAIGQGGLRNSGEAARLVDPAGRVVSSYGGHIDFGAAQGRSAVRTGACDVAASWATSGDEGPTPGRL